MLVLFADIGAVMCQSGAFKFNCAGNDFHGAGRVDCHRAAACVYVNKSAQP